MIPFHKNMLPSPPRMGLAWKLAMAEQDEAEAQTVQDQKRCPEFTKSGRPCRGYATETGKCAGHSKAGS